jgi:predicted  nucleic acid-binding Zn-ribbon protein
LVRRFLTRVLMVILIGFCGYNWLQVRQLQTQVAGLEAKAALRSSKTEATRQDLPMDWQTAQRRLAALQAQVKQLRDEADVLWQKANAAQNGIHRVTHQGKTLP